MDEDAVRPARKPKTVSAPPPPDPPDPPPPATERVAVNPLATTLAKEDYLGVDLVNPVAGTSPATDRLGRAVIAGNKDYLGRPLTTVPWVTLTAYKIGDAVYIGGAAELTCIAAGVSGATSPTVPGIVGGTVVDGTVTWQRTE